MQYFMLFQRSPASTKTLDLEIGLLQVLSEHDQVLIWGGEASCITIQFKNIQGIKILIQICSFSFIVHICYTNLITSN